MISSKRIVQYLHSFCKQAGLDNWVLSPGSRNAPVTITLGNDPFFNIESVVDERSAGFIAMGKSLSLGKPVGVCCTSGSAALNYSPSIAEAFYQEIPMFIVTADRPQHWIGHGEGQSINQIDVFKNYVCESFHLDEDSLECEIVQTFESIYKSLYDSLSQGPVHLNISFEEPLYDSVDSYKEVSLNFTNADKEFTKLSCDDWNDYKKVLILCGQMKVGEQLNHQLKELSMLPQVVVMTETTSNHFDFEYVNCIDRTLAGSDLTEDYKPDLVITIGGAVISKKIKQFLRSIDNLHHWHVSQSGKSINMFKKLTKTFSESPKSLFKRLIKINSYDSISQYRNTWLTRSFLNKEKADEYLLNISWSDLQVFDTILDLIPKNIVLHMGNSSVVRYIQLFNPDSSISYQGNRGVSGIDGSTSTAVGYASESKKLNILISGDLSFGYDSNAFWNGIIKDNLKVIVINNGGGGIFRIIQGPNQTGVVEDRFDVNHNMDISSLCRAHQVSYLRADSLKELESKFVEFIESRETIVMEVFTSKEVSPDVLNAFFL